MERCLEETAGRRDGTEESLWDIRVWGEIGFRRHHSHDGGETSLPCPQDAVGLGLEFLEQSQPWM